MNASQPTKLFTVAGQISFISHSLARSFKHSLGFILNLELSEYGRRIPILGWERLWSSFSALYRNSVCASWAPRSSYDRSHPQLWDLLQPRRPSLPPFLPSASRTLLSVGPFTLLAWQLLAFQIWAGHIALKSIHQPPLCPLIPWVI